MDENFRKLKNYYTIKSEFDKAIESFSKKYRQLSIIRGQEIFTYIERSIINTEYKHFEKYITNNVREKLSLMFQDYWLYVFLFRVKEDLQNHITPQKIISILIFYLYKYAIFDSKKDLRLFLKYYIIQSFLSKKQPEKIDYVFINLIVSYTKKIEEELECILNKMEFKYQMELFQIIDSKEKKYPFLEKSLIYNLMP